MNEVQIFAEELWDYIPPAHRVPTPLEREAEKIQRFREGTKELTDKTRLHSRHWKLQAAVRETDVNHTLGPGIIEIHLCCAEDMQSIWRLSSGGSYYATTIWDIEAGMMRHYLQCHRENIDDGTNAEQLGEELGNSGADNPRSKRRTVRTGSKAKGGHSKRNKGSARNTG